jgi:integrase
LLQGCIFGDIFSEHRTGTQNTPLETAISKLTVLDIRNAKGPCRLSDGEGLFFEITDKGMKRWLYRFKLDGKNGMFIVGRYPSLSLKEAREKHQQAKSLVNQGIKPAQKRRDNKQANIDKEREKKDVRTKSFQYVALEWVEQQREAWSTDHARAVTDSLRNNIFTHIGDRPVDDITPPDVLKVLRKIEKRGSLEIARKVLQRMGAVFRYAIQTGRATYNPAADMQGVLKAKTVEHMPAVFDKEISQLLKDINASTKMHITTKLALQFTTLTACRSGEVRNALWSEIFLEEREWHIPVERMKMRRPHIVPLSKQALAVLNRAAALFGKEGLIFPSARDDNKPMSANAMSKALRDMGYRGKATPHGFRSSFSFMTHGSAHPT